MAIIGLEGRNYLSLAVSCSPLLVAGNLSGFDLAATPLALEPLESVREPPIWLTVPSLGCGQG